MNAKTTAADSSDILSQVKASVADVGQAAAEEIDNRRRAAAAGIKSAAKNLHEKADDLPDGLPGAERVAEVAHGAADKLTSTANYVRRRNFTGMAKDVRKAVKDNPLPAIVGAAAFGFLLAKVFSSRE